MKVIWESLEVIYVSDIIFRSQIVMARFSYILEHQPWCPSSLTKQECSGVGFEDITARCTLWHLDRMIVPEIHLRDIESSKILILCAYCYLQFAKISLNFCLGLLWGWLMHGPLGQHSMVACPRTVVSPATTRLEGRDEVRLLGLVQVLPPDLTDMWERLCQRRWASMAIPEVPMTDVNFYITLVEAQPYKVQDKKCRQQKKEKRKG